MAQQLRGEGLDRGKAHEGREPRQPGSVGGKRVRLRVVDHLQAVLDPAQEAVGGGEFGRGLGADASGLRQRRERIASFRLAQRGKASAPDQLLRLREEFDLADAAAADLDVVSGDRDARAAAMGVDLTLDRMDVLDGGKIQMLAPQERPQLREKGGAGGDVAGDRPRLDQRRALPILPGALVIGERGDDRQRGRRRAGIGAQPEVAAEDIAVRGALLDQPHQLLRQPPEEPADVVLSGVARPFPVIEEDKVDIAGIVQLTRAELAHGEDDETALPLGRGGVGGGQLALALGSGEEMARRGGDRGVGEAAERAGDALELPPTGDVGDRDQQRHLALRDAQRPHQPLLVGLGCEMAIEPTLDIRQSSLRPLLHEPHQKVRFLETALREERAVAEKRCKQPVPRRVGGKITHEGGKRWILDLLRGLAPALEAESHLVGIAGRRQARISGGRQ